MVYRAGRWVADHFIMFTALLVLAYMFLPIFFVVLMSFNDPTSRLNYEFQAFTWDNWLDPCSEAGMCESVVKSLQIGFLATVFATILGTLVAFALVRHRFRGRAPTSLLIFLPMATPEVVMGSSLLALFAAAGLAGNLGFWSILVAHESGRRTLVQGSAGFVTGSLDGHEAEVAYLGVGQLGVLPEDYLVDY